MICYDAQLSWQMVFREAFLADRQVNPPLYDDQADDPHEGEEHASPPETVH